MTEIRQPTLPLLVGLADASLRLVRVLLIFCSASGEQNRRVRDSHRIGRMDGLNFEAWSIPFHTSRYASSDSTPLSTQKLDSSLY